MSAGPGKSATTAKPSLPSGQQTAPTRINNSNVNNNSNEVKKEAKGDNPSEDNKESTRDVDPSELLIFLQSQLECPICMELSCPPVYQCVQGHITCHTCIQKISNQCGICRASMGMKGEYIRCRPLELMAEKFDFECGNLRCGKTIPYLKYEEHFLKECPMRPQPKPKTPPPVAPAVSLPHPFNVYHPNMTNIDPVMALQNAIQSGGFIVTPNPADPRFYSTNRPMMPEPAHRSPLFPANQGFNGFNFTNQPPIEQRPQPQSGGFFSPNRNNNQQQDPRPQNPPLGFGFYSLPAPTNNGFPGFGSASASSNSASPFSFGVSIDSSSSSGGFSFRPSNTTASQPSSLTVGSGRFNPQVETPQSRSSSGFSFTTNTTNSSQPSRGGFSFSPSGPAETPTSPGGFSFAYPNPSATRPQVTPQPQNPQQFSFFAPPPPQNSGGFTFSPPEAPNATRAASNSAEFDFEIRPFSYDQ